MTESDLQVDIIRSREGIETIREHWERFQWHPNTDIDIYHTVVESRPEIIEPYVLVYREAETGEPVAITVGRRERNPLAMKFGYTTLYRPTLNTISVLYGGFLGETSPRVMDALTRTLWSSLQQGEAELATCKFLAVDSPARLSMRSLIPARYRDFKATETIHWRIAVPEDTETYLKKFKKIRRKSKVNPEKHYPGQVEVKCLTELSDVDTIGEVCADISAGTYHSGLGVAFTNDHEHLEQLRLWAERGVLRAYILWLGGESCGYYIGFTYGDTFHFMATGYKEKFRNESPGTFLLMHIIRDIMEGTDLTYLDFGFGDAFYKRRFANEQWMESTAHIFAPSLKGVVLNGLNSSILTLSETTQHLMQKYHIEQRLKTIWRRKLAKSTDSGERGASR